MLIAAIVARKVIAREGQYAESNEWARCDMAHKRKIKGAEAYHAYIAREVRRLRHVGN